MPDQERWPWDQQLDEEGISSVDKDIVEETDECEAKQW